jgi:hypothetical protein
MTAAPQHYDEVLPYPGFEITPGSTAIVITDPQVDFLSKDGVTWAIVGPSVEKNGTLENLCVEAHMRDLIEDGFEVAIAKDATAGAVLPKGDAYEAALLNFRMIASSVQTTDELVSQLQG